MHDSQVAIPLAQMSESRIINLYELMDAAYDVSEIHNYSKSKERIPIIDDNLRGSKKKKIDSFKVAYYMMFAVIVLTAKKIFTLLPQTV